MYCIKFEFLATLSAFSAGVVLGWTSPILESLTKGKYNGIPIDDNQMGWIGKSIIQVKDLFDNFFLLKFLTIKTTSVTIKLYFILSGICLINKF